MIKRIMDDTIVIETAVIDSFTVYRAACETDCNTCEKQCCTCKQHYSQGGKCVEEKRNCPLYEEEPRGKMLQTTLSLNMKCLAETPIVKLGSRMVLEENNGVIETTIIKINWIDSKSMICNVDVEHYESEPLRFEKVNKIKILN